jgi:hypothetical protein
VTGREPRAGTLRAPAAVHGHVIMLGVRRSRLRCHGWTDRGSTVDADTEGRLDRDIAARIRCSTSGCRSAMCCRKVSRRVRPV